MADKWPKELTKGDFNPDFGFYIERPFYIVSELAQKRFLTILGRNIAIKERNGRTQQVWYFDQKSLTVKNKSNNQSLDIVSSGKGRNMQVWSTNGQWW
jgi:hypothetical protein